jgi:MYXO-CTERM domain-containing protein
LKWSFQNKLPEKTRIRLDPGQPKPDNNAMKKTISLTLLLLCLFLTNSAPASSVQASWDAVTQDIQGGTETISHYLLYWGAASRPAAVTNPANGSFTYDQSQNVGNVLQRRIDGLTGGQTYYFSVVAVDAAGNKSDYSQEISVVTPVEEDSGPVDAGPDAGDSGTDTGSDTGTSPGNDQSGDVTGSCGCSAQGGSGDLGLWGVLLLGLWLMGNRRRRN